MRPDDHLASLIAAAREGDDVAVDAFVRATHADVARLCRILGSPDDTDDLVQETYLRTLASLRTYRGDASARAWLLAIARHTCADHVRRRVRARSLAERLRRHTFADVAPGPDHTADLLDVLDADRREAFVLTQQLDLSYEEAAAVVGCPIGTIRSRVARARDQLRSAALAAEAG